MVTRQWTLSLCPSVGFTNPIPRQYPSKPLDCARTGEAKAIVMKKAIVAKLYFIFCLQDLVHSAMNYNARVPLTMATHC